MKATRNKDKYLQLEKKFLKNGYVKFKANKILLNSLVKQIKGYIVKYTKIKNPNLKNFHNQLQVSKLNSLRIKIYDELNKSKNFQENLHFIGEKSIEQMVGSEFVRGNLNLSIQYPGDKNSLLSAHTDFFSGESIFQINLWIPFVDVKKTSSMFIINPIKSIKLLKKIKNSSKFTMDKIFKEAKKDIRWIPLKFGEYIIFSPNCLHGNVTNQEKISRWSINVRYKNLFSPYSKIRENEKKIGTFYNKINPKIVTKFNMFHDFDELIK